MPFIPGPVCPTEEWRWRRRRKMVKEKNGLIIVEAIVEGKMIEIGGGLLLIL